jgi:mannose-6-phosphate isomerase-like protein (cupin superfamily)
MWDEKQWGRNTWLHYSPDLEICRAEIERGGYSSMHRHKNKHNLFVVLSGKLVIKNETLMTDCLIVPGDAPVNVHARQWHRFISLDRTVLIEVYSKAGHAPIDLVDIERQDVGGICKDAADLSKLGCQEIFA